MNIFKVIYTLFNVPHTDSNGNIIYDTTIVHAKVKANNEYDAARKIESSYDEDIRVYIRFDKISKV